MTEMADFDGEEFVDKGKDEDALKHDKRVKIKYNPADLDNVAAQAAEVLKNVGIFFNYTKKLVTIEDVETLHYMPIFDANGQYIRKDLVSFKMAGIREIDPAWLKGYLTKLMVFLKFDGRAKKEVAVSPPPDVCMDICKRQWERLLPLRGIITCPTMRRDGSLLYKKGYDAATGYYLTAEVPISVDWLETAKIDRQLALKALNTLRGVFNEIPYVDKLGTPVPYDATTNLPAVSTTSEAVLLSAAMSAILRPAMATVPCHVVTSPVYGSGKTFALELVGTIALGKRPPVLSYLYRGTGASDENDKMLKSVLKAGHPIVILDNVNGVLHGQVLTQMITQTQIDFRDFGVLEMANTGANNFSTVLANGVNTTPNEDLERRCLVSVINPHSLNPELRRYKDPIRLERTIRERGALIECVIAMVKAYQQAGSPEVLGDGLAGFEDWNRIVRSTLVWLGCADPTGQRQEVKWESPANMTRGALIKALHISGAETVWRTAPDWIAEAVKLRLEGDRTLADAIMAVAEKNGGMDTARLGNYMARNKGTPSSDGYAIASQLNSSTNTNEWGVRKMVLGN